MFKPHITLATVVHCQGKFLFVEEFEHGKWTLNQPAGHLEANESLLEGASRELFEETGICREVQALLRVYQWHGPESQKDFLRFTFALDLDQCLPTAPQDKDIRRALWLSLEEFDDYIKQEGQAARNPLVRQAVLDFLQVKPVSLDLLMKL